jgi:hypothetical protein
MKFILDALTRGHVTNIVLKFPSYCLMNILSPLLIYPRTYSLSYLSTINENDSKRSRSDINIFTQNFLLPRRRQKLCLQVQIHSIEENKNISRVLSTSHHHAIEEADEEENSSTDTTHAVISDSINSSRDSLDPLSNSQLIHIPSESLVQIENQPNIPILQSSHLIPLPDNNK